MSLADPNSGYYTRLWKITVNDFVDVVWTWGKYFYVLTKNVFNFLLKVLNVSDRIQIAIGFYIEFYWGQEKAGKTIWNNFNFRKEFLRQEIKQIFDGSRKFYFVKICM